MIDTCRYVLVRPVDMSGQYCQVFVCEEPAVGWVQVDVPGISWQFIRVCEEHAAVVERAGTLMERARAAIARL